MGKRFNISFLFFLLSPLFLISQNFVVFSELTDESYVFDGQFYPHQKQSISNYFLHELALGNTSTSIGFSYSFNYQLNKIIFKQNKNYSNAKIKIITKPCTGDVYYKGFSVSEELKPSAMNFVVDVYSDNYIIASRTYSNINIKTENIKIPDLSFENINTTKNYSLKIKDISFFYNDNDKEIFNNKIFFINDYYASVAIIDSSLNYISGFDIENHDKIFINCFKRFEVKQIEKKLRAKNFDEKLNLQDFDPVKFTSKYYTFQLQIIRINTLLDMLLNSGKTSSRFPEISELSNYYISRQLYYIELSRRVNHFFTPSFYNLALQKPTISDLCIFAEVVKKSNNSLISSSIIRKKLNDLANNLFEDYLRTANYFLADKRYNEAIDILDNARELTMRVSYLGNLDKLNILISNAKFGIYSSFLKVANKAISIENKGMAEEYLNRAKEFQMVNRDFISNSEKAENAYIKLAELYYNEGVENNNNGNYKLAIENFSKATQFSGTNMYDLFSESLYSKSTGSKAGANRNVSAKEQIVINDNPEKNKIFAKTTAAKQNLKSFSRCQSVINESKSLFSQENFSDALTKLNEAKQFVREDQTINFQIDSLIERTASSLIMQQVYNAVMLLMDDEFYKAKKLYQRSLKLQEEYVFLNRQDITNALHDLYELIDESKCKSLKNNYKNNLTKGQNAVEHRNYLKAAVFFTEVINIANEASDCNISIAEAQNEYNKYLPAINYQKMMQSIIEDIFDKGLTSVIDRYREMGVYYNDFHINEFGLIHVSFYEFLFSQNNPQLIINTLDHYNKTGQYYSSLELLKVLFDQSFPSSLISLQQKELGKKIAEKDFAFDAEKSSGENISDKMQENKWFKDYCRAYKNEWRKKSIAALFSSPENADHKN